MVKVPELAHPAVVPLSDQLPVMVLLLSVPEKLSELLPLVPEPDVIVIARLPEVVPVVEVSVKVPLTVAVELKQDVGVVKVRLLPVTLPLLSLLRVTVKPMLGETLLELISDAVQFPFSALEVVLEPHPISASAKMIEVMIANFFMRLLSQGFEFSKTDTQQQNNVPWMSEPRIVACEWTLPLIER